MRTRKIANRFNIRNDKRDLFATSSILNFRMNVNRTMALGERDICADREQSTRRKCKIQVVYREIIYIFRTEFICVMKFCWENIHINRYFIKHWLKRDNKKETGQEPRRLENNMPFSFSIFKTLKQIGIDLCSLCQAKLTFIVAFFLWSHQSGFA